MRSIILPLILLSAVLAFAGYDVVNIQPGESHPIFPGVVKAVQLNASNVLPASGTVSIGEITKRWETEETNVFFRVSGSGIFDGDHVAYIADEYEGQINYRSKFQSSAGEVTLGWNLTEGANEMYIYVGNAYCYDGYPEFEDMNLPKTNECVCFAPPLDGVTVTLTLLELEHTVHHATTNALWTVTAAGGNAVTNFPDKTFLETPANDWVRYGTATSGAVKLYVED